MSLLYGMSYLFKSLAILTKIKTNSLHSMQAFYLRRKSNLDKFFSSIESKTTGSNGLDLH